MPSPRLAFIGAGNMAEAILRGALRAGLVTPDAVSAADPSPDRRRLFHDDLGVTVAESADTLIGAADLVVLAVKPQVADAVLAPLAARLTPDKLLVSIAAGVSIERLTKLTSPDPPRIIRTMPNTPMLVGRGMVVLSPAPDCSDDDVARARDLFAASAAVLQLPESSMDAVTAVSGSGPAYFFLLVEALAAAGARLGLSPGDAALLAATTFAGSAELLASTGLAPEELRRRVTSPGGTTAAAIDSFTRDHFHDVVARAARAAAARSAELGRPA